MPRFCLAAQQARYQAGLNVTIRAYHEVIASSYPIHPTDLMQSVRRTRPGKQTEQGTHSSLTALVVNTEYTPPPPSLCSHSAEEDTGITKSKQAQTHTQPNRREILMLKTFECFDMSPYIFRSPHHLGGPPPPLRRTSPLPSAR